MIFFDCHFNSLHYKAPLIVTQGQNVQISGNQNLCWHDNSPEQPPAERNRKGFHCSLFSQMLLHLVDSLGHYGGGKICFIWIPGCY